MTFVLAPTSIDLYPEKLPPYAKNGMHQKIINEVADQLHPNIRLVDPIRTIENTER